MNDKGERKKEIMHDNFPLGGLIVISILGIFGFGLIYFSGIFSVKNYNMLYDCFSKDGLSIIIGVFFLCTFLYCFIEFFINVILKPKKAVLFLLRNEDDKSVFINKMGKAFTIPSSNKINGKFYNVLKTHDYIYEIMDERTDINEIWSEKKSYWLNFYSPIFNFEDMLLLPIVYIILLIGIISFIMAKGFNKIYGAIFCAFPLYIIIYDLIYKIKLNKSGNYIGSENDISFLILKRMIAIIISGILFFVLTRIFNNFSSAISRIILLPFYGCGIGIAGQILSSGFGNNNLLLFFTKFSVIFFLVFWFGFTTFFVINMIKQKNDYNSILFAIPFYLFGFYIFYRYILKK
jgi:hypothetical protein